MVRNRITDKIALGYTQVKIFQENKNAFQTRKKPFPPLVSLIFIRPIIPTKHKITKKLVCGSVILIRLNIRLKEIS